MKSEIEQLMMEEEIDLLWVTGPAFHNPAMVYLTGGGHLSQADYIQRRGDSGTLFYSPMERDEAAKTGLFTRGYDQAALQNHLNDNQGDPIRAHILLYEQMLGDLNFHAGRVALYGSMDAGAAFAIYSGLSRKFPAIDFVGYQLDGLLAKARMTKDIHEVERIRAMGTVTTRVAERLIDYLTQHRVKAGVLMGADHQPLMVAEVKNKINLWLVEEGAENPEGTIFSLGRDAAVPHSVGNPADLLREGVPIVFDIFPCEEGGGYYHDFTRTWCLGYAPDEVWSIYEDVLDVYEQVLADIQMGQPFFNYHKLACDLFEQKGHPTILSNQGTQEGFVHGLGHGVGLDVHELPYYKSAESDKNDLKPGTVLAIEPGLYYPDKNIGVRLENTFWMRPEGKLENLGEFPLDLVLPLRG